MRHCCRPMPALRMDDPDDPDDPDARVPGCPGAAIINRIGVARNDDVAAEVSGATPGSCFLVMTHSHEHDLRICACNSVIRRSVRSVPRESC